MKPSKDDKAFVEACGCPQKRTELLDSLMLTRRICAIILYIFILIYWADYFFSDRNIFSIDSSSVIMGAVLIVMLVWKSDADTKIKILLLQK
jgi:hypothetical protein